MEADLSLSLIRHCTGLTICKNLINLMSGTIGLQSEEGKGSKAWVSDSMKDERCRGRKSFSNLKELLRL